MTNTKSGLWNGQGLGWYKMACAFCRNWEQETLRDWHCRIEEWQGDCLLRPVSVKTSGYHTCAKLTLTDPKYVAYLREQLGRDGKKISELRDKLKKVTARNKVLNAKIRSLAK